MLAEKQRGRLSNWYVQAWARYHLRRLGRKDYMSTDEHDPYHPPPGYGQPRYVMHRTDSNGANKIVWGVAAFAVICLVTINGIMWSKMWDMAQSLTRLETTVSLILQRLPP
jgi:hypothetical protein